jgi:2-dehydropantoate 2-reductase
MAQDVAKGRPTEIDYMNGFVVAKGREKSIATPVSAAVVETMHEVERGQRKQAPENIGVTLKRAGL